MHIHEATGIPVVFDYLHHKFCTGGLTEEEAVSLAYTTWPTDIVPVVHYSSSRRRFEDPMMLETVHADYIYGHVNTYGRDLDVMLEAKAKEKAIVRYVAEYGEI